MANSITCVIHGATTWCDRAQRADDRRWCAGDLLARGRRRGRHRHLRLLPGTGWLLFDGLVTLVIAAMMSAWPISAAWAIGTLVGVSMFFSGMTRLMLSVAVRRIVA